MTQFAHQNGARSFDLRYLRRPPALHHRPYFSFVERFAHERLCRDDDPTLLDIGCANGAFIHFMLGRFPKARFVGIDVLSELVHMAQSCVPEAVFRVGDLTAPGTLPSERYSVITLLTLHTHFDDWSIWLDNVLTLGRAGAKVLIFGPFNPEPVDVLVRVRPSEDSEGPWIPGWNLHSRRTVGGLLERRALRFSFHDYVSPVIAPDSSDPLRSYTALLDSKRVCANGAGLILQMALLEIVL